MTGFVPSRDKFEAVNRLSSLTRTGPEELGPGSKERKRVLVNVVDFLDLPIDTALNKILLGQEIVGALGGTWDKACYSTGYTITLVGLDRVLRLASDAALERGRLALPKALTIEEEAERILSACSAGFTAALDMRTCVVQMKNRGDRNWAQSEWPGWYFESTGRALCMAMAGGGPGPKYGSVRFDYQLIHVWDFKAHSLRMASGRRNPTMILNDSEAIDACVAAEAGLGFIVGHGAATYDTNGSLRAWMADLKKTGAVKSRASKSGRSRDFKATFAMTHIDALFFPDSDIITAGLADGWLQGDFQTGFHQIDGTNVRRGKYQLNGDAVPRHLLVGQYQMPDQGSLFPT